VPTIDKSNKRRDVPTLPPFLEERLEVVLLILEKSKHAKAFAGNDKIGNGPAFFETWLVNADKIDAPEPSYTADEIR
jgi:hypothetical protein